MPARFAVLVGLLSGVPASGGERYYATFFGSQSVPRRAPLTHTFVAIMRVSDTPVGRSVAVRSISWLPATLVIRDLRFRPEPGVNLPLPETLALVRGQGQRVSVWGPYEIPPEVHARLTAQADRVDSGYYQYQAIDDIRRAPDVVDCIHAVTDADPRFGRGHYPLSRFGESATHRIVQQFFARGLILNRDSDNGGLLSLLGVASEEVVRRDYRDAPLPRFDPFWRLRGRWLPTRWDR